MSWSIRDPPSPISVPSLESEGTCPSKPGSPNANTRYSSPTPRADSPPQCDPPPSVYPESAMCSPSKRDPPPSLCPVSGMDLPPQLYRQVHPSLSPTPAAYSPPRLSPYPSLPPNITLDLVGQEQWSTNPLQIKSTFTIIGEPDFQLLSSAACGMGWNFNLDLRPATTSIGRKGKRKTKRSVVTDPSVVAVHASLQPGPAGFPPGNYSIRASFRREGCVLTVLEDDQEGCSFPKQSTISLGRCNIPLPLGEILIDLVVTLSFSDSEPSSEVPRTISASMSKAIRATLDGEFPVDVKFMLFSRKYGETFVCDRRPIYANRNILKGRNSFLDSYMKGSPDSDDIPSPDVYQYPYDEDSDLESDLEDLPCDVPETSDITAREPQPDSLSRPLSPVNITELDTVQSMPPESRSSKISPVASIFDVDDDSDESSRLFIRSYKKATTKRRLSHALIDSQCFGKSDSIGVSAYEKAVSPSCDVVDEPMGRCAEDYEADKVESQEKVSASLPHLALINDVAFRTFRALMIYMYTKEVTFIPLKSSGGRSYNIGDACSPKSMYRLAVKASHEGLKKHSFDNFCSQLGPKNIITEIFSRFTADFPEIFEMELKVLLDHFTNPVVRDEWERMIDMVASGRLPHGADVLKKVTRALRT
ncbi:uncharacterized protein ARMOST_21137 [Armillaria ostoyae]|uniref:BTB domain-containing protein n=1 Tax=Armillaria ostoyae TaxID=47428 RepID=A0A284S9D1_ARMOS|nr:uncharacterized protein ARMOST_21137 [Armillaria ostoyae]